MWVLVYVVLTVLGAVALPRLYELLWLRQRPRLPELEEFAEWTGFLILIVLAATMLVGILARFTPRRRRAK